MVPAPYAQKQNTTYKKHNPHVILIAVARAFPLKPRKRGMVSISMFSQVERTNQHNGKEKDKENEKGFVRCKKYNGNSQRRALQPFPNKTGNRPNHHLRLDHVKLSLNVRPSTSGHHAHVMACHRTVGEPWYIPPLTYLELVRSALQSATSYRTVENPRSRISTRRI
jgi:hypothetical protein